MDTTEMRKVPVERHVTQVRDGSHYRGHVKIVDTKLDYELMFGVPISQLDDVAKTMDESEVLRLFQIEVTRNGSKIELTDEEYGFFFSMVVELAIDFYNDPGTRSQQGGMFGHMLNGRGPIAAMGASLSIGMTSSGSCSLTPEICNMLSAPKFGCSLGTV